MMVLAPPKSVRTKLGDLAVAAFLHITGLPDSRLSRVTRQGREPSNACYHEAWLSPHGVRVSRGG